MRLIRTKKQILMVFQICPTNFCRSRSAPGYYLIAYRNRDDKAISFPGFNPPEHNERWVTSHWSSHQLPRKSRVILYNIYYTIWRALPCPKSLILMGCVQHIISIDNLTRYITTRYQAYPINVTLYVRSSATRRDTSNGLNVAFNSIGITHGTTPFTGHIATMYIISRD